MKPPFIPCFIYDIKSSFFSQSATLLSALSTLPPRITKSDNTFAFEQSFLISRSLLPIPLPSCVQYGTMVFPDKSYLLFCVQYYILRSATGHLLQLLRVPGPLNRDL
jgi:hypothetical protein